MPRPWDVWKIIREIDLEAVRAEAERAFRVLVLAESRRDAEDLAALLSGSRKGDPWLVVAETGPQPVPVPLPDVAVLVSRDPDLSPRLGMSAMAINGRGVPLVTIVTGTRGGRDAVVRPGEAARAAVPDFAAEHAPAVAQALLSGAPSGLRLALGRRLPPLRDPLYDALIEETARANAIYALGTGVVEAFPLLSLPLNLADIVVLTKNQIVMAYRIALGAGRRGTIRAVLGQALSVIGSAFMLRQLARQLIGLVPVAGIAPKVAVAYAGTWAVGRAVAAWAGGGAELTKASVKRYYAEALDRGRRAADVLAFAAKVGRVKRGRRSS
jgi:uncharacterized protein (DUF697 family)